MTVASQMLDDDHVDDGVDDVIAECLNPAAPKSFFLYAGAGSGKTGSLVKALERFRDRSGNAFRKEGRRIGVVTYTNAACDEITRRIGFDPLFAVSTIHSFCWSMIAGFHDDIRAWLKVKIPVDITDLEDKQSRGRANSKAYLDRERSIVAKTARLVSLDQIKVFTYDPNGDNFGRDSLSHTEVIQIASSFLSNKPLMQSILINRFPFLLIDESQDTNRYVIDAVLAVQRTCGDRFALGLFGDTMQRIYTDGKADLGQDLPGTWKKPVKKMNHRSAHRIIGLGNSIRRPVDQQTQQGRKDRPEGHVRLFVAPAGTTDKPAIEGKIRDQMAEITGDPGWGGKDPVVKALTLEHHMAVSRMGFADMFEPLYAESRLSTGLLNDDLDGIRLFSKQVLPVLTAQEQKEQFTIAALLKKYSPLLKKEAFINAKERQLKQLGKVRAGVKALTDLVAGTPVVRFIDVLRCVAQHDLFEVPVSLHPYLEDDAGAEDDDDDDKTGVTAAWRNFLEAPFSQIVPYVEYIADRAPYGTHHGVKGLEFPRVMVLMDDSARRGFSFPYEKLFGVKAKSSDDLKKEQEGQETGRDRTRRLLYVTCTRARDSLALVAYTDSPDALVSHAVSESWVALDEVVRV